MDGLIAALNDYVPIAVSIVAATVSFATILVNSRLGERKERRKLIWERRVDRLMELEDRAGRLVEDLMRFRMRTPEGRESIAKDIEYFRVAAGLQYRHTNVRKAIWDFEHAASWLFSRDMKHESKDAYESAKRDVEESFFRLISACDEALQAVDA